MNRLRHFFIVFIFTFSSGVALSQKEGNIWYFGYNAGIDFNSGVPVTLTNGAIHTTEGCSSISDALTGNLLFYTDGITVWNSNHVIMANGTGLTGNSTSTQSAMIIKQPGSQSTYYIFSLYSSYAYSVVDMALNGGLGGVTAAKNVVIYPSLISEKQCATRHANGTDIWIMMRDNSSFLAYKLTSTGFISTPVQSTIGFTPAVIGQMKFSPQGDKIVMCRSGNPDICVCDFDNSTGIVSNNIDLDNGNSQCYGVEFSPDGSKLYATGNPSAIKKVYQYDLNAGSQAAILASQVLVGTAAAGDVTGLQTGPDGKIYVCRASTSYLGAINNPDSLGLACNYVDQAVNLGTAQCQLGLPELISDYFNPASGLSNHPAGFSVSVFPNPAADYFYISNKDFKKPYTAKLFDITGQLVFAMNIVTPEQKINISGLAKGIYLIKTNRGEGTFSEKIVVY